MGSVPVAPDALDPLKGQHEGNNQTAFHSGYLVAAVLLGPGVMAKPLLHVP